MCGWADNQLIVGSGQGPHKGLGPAPGLSQQLAFIGSLDIGSKLSEVHG